MSDQNETPGAQVEAPQTYIDANSIERIVGSDVPTGRVEVHGRLYNTVAKRLEDFWNDHPPTGEAWRIITKVESAADEVRVRCKIYCGDWVMATGHSAKKRGNTGILATSALEACETASIGRALSVLGYSGGEIAGAEEVANAVRDQKESTELHFLREHNAAVRAHIHSIAAIKHHLADEKFDLAFEAYHEIPHEDLISLWRSVKAGGVWTTAERAAMKSNNFNKAAKAYEETEK